MTRKKNSKFQRWALMIVVPVFLIVSVCEFCVQVLRPLSTALMLDGSAQAVIISVEQFRNGRHGSSLLSNCGIRYEFFVDGMRYEGPQDVASSLSGYCPPIGSSLKIRYAVDDPAYNVWGVEYNFSSLNLLWTAVTFVIVCTFAFAAVSLVRRVRSLKPSTPISQDSVVKLF